MTTFSLDRVNSADAEAVARAAVDFLDRAQDYGPEVRTMGVAAVFMAFTRKYRVDPSEVFRAITNLLATKHRESPYLRTLDLYVAHED